MSNDYRYFDAKYATNTSNTFGNWTTWRLPTNISIGLDDPFLVDCAACGQTSKEMICAACKHAIAIVRERMAEKMAQEIEEMLG